MLCSKLHYQQGFYFILFPYRLCPRFNPGKSVSVPYSDNDEYHTNLLMRPNCVVIFKSPMPSPGMHPMQNQVLPLYEWNWARLPFALPEIIHGDFAPPQKQGRISGWGANFGLAQFRACIPCRARFTLGEVEGICSFGFSDVTWPNVHHLRP